MTENLLPTPVLNVFEMNALLTDDLHALIALTFTVYSVRGFNPLNVAVGSVTVWFSDV